MPDHFFTSQDGSEKRVGLVYNSDNQNYQPLDFSKNFTSGMLIDSAYCIAGGQGAGKFSSQSQIQTLSSAKRGYISQNIDSTDSNVFVIVGSGIGANASDTFASLQWRETR